MSSVSLSFDNNVKDMNEAVKRLADAMEGSDPYISKALYLAVETVAGEWNGHLSNDCEAVSPLLIELDDAQQEILELQVAVGDLDRQLENRCQEIDELSHDINRHLNTITVLENDS